MINVNFCGCNSMHQTTMERCFPNGYSDHTLLLIKTESYFKINGTIIDMPQNTVMIYQPNFPIHYGCRNSRYNDDWIHFELHDEDKNLLQTLNLPINHPFLTPNLCTLTDYSKQIVTEKHSSHTYKLEVINSLMHAFLYTIANQMITAPNDIYKNKYYYSMNKLRTEFFNMPYKKWSIPMLANQIHISESHFQHLYKTFFGVTCTQDIIDSRIKYAQFLLQTSEMSISLLSSFCGYDNELHFMRQFKKKTGLTPSQYRNTVITSNK